MRSTGIVSLLFAFALAPPLFTATAVFADDEEHRTRMKSSTRVYGDDDFAGRSMHKSETEAEVRSGEFDSEEEAERKAAQAKRQAQRAMDTSEEAEEEAD
jgi:hypothetical protein